MFGRILIAVGALAVVLVAALVSQAPRGPAPAAKRNAEAGVLSGASELLRREELPPPFDRLQPHHAPKRAPQPGDWLADHEESGQSYADYVASEPIRASDTRRTIYVQPLGEFSAEQQRIAEATYDYVRRYFGVPVKVLEPRPTSSIPDGARRLHPRTGEQQVWTIWVLQELLARRPDDALALIALTTSDLYPAEDWNFVFGQASLRDRVGVWSIDRFGDPAESPEAYRRVLRRTVATAVHELGHMVSIHHCIAWECVMNGSNSLEESDAAAIELCPSDLAKLVHATGVDPAKRYDALIEFWEAQRAEPELVNQLRSGGDLLRLSPESR